MLNKQKNKLVCIFGLGLSGISAARYLQKIKQNFFVVDTRESPAEKSHLDILSCCQSVHFGTIPQEKLNQVELIILSPGISPKLPELLLAKKSGAKIVGDIEIFVSTSNKKIVAITGSNGKSTVTDLTNRLLKAAGVNSVIGGNFGIPALDYLPEDSADIYVLELSSFQLDTTYSLNADVAVLLNITEDHMDRYDNFETYKNSKLSILQGAKLSLVNQDDPNLQEIKKENIIFFSNRNEKSQYHLKFYNHKISLSVKGKILINADELAMSGLHNLQNVLVALAILDSLNIQITDSVIAEVKQYQGLPHRFQLVAREQETDWINDSKATNVGATQAALNSIQENYYGIVILIVGGDAKGSDLSVLKTSFEKVQHLILIGKDGQEFAKLVETDKTTFVNSMQEAVNKSLNLVTHFRKNLTKADNQKALVLLSPACSSLDMYKNFETRGNAFIDAIRKCA